MGLCCSSSNNGLDGRAEVPQKIEKKEAQNSKRPLTDYLDEEEKAEAEAEAEAESEDIAGSIMIAEPDTPPEL